MHTINNIEDIRIAVNTISEAGLESELTIPEDIFASLLNNPDITVKEPLSIHYIIERNEDMVHAEIDVKGHISAQCVVCLAQIEYPIDKHLETDYLPAEPDMKHDLEAERQSASIGYYRKEIPLGEYIISELVLSLPIRYVCRQDCKGLCTQCGANLNDGNCQCEKPHDLRFDKLLELKNKLKKE